MNNINKNDLQFCFSVEHHSINDVSVQANIPDLPPVPCRKVTKDACTIVCENVNIGQFLTCSGFHGVNSLTVVSDYVELAGVSLKVFQFLLVMVPDNNKFKMTNENRLLLFLMKIKLGMSYCSLGILFSIHRTTASRIFLHLLETLCIKTKDYIFWPSKYTVQKFLPPAFKIHYPNTRVIIDCTEVKAEQPHQVDQRNFMYSFYKSSYTIKFLVGITPSGFISFKSKCYGGRASDSYITNDCKIATLLEPGDIVLADKGFPGIQTNIPNSIVIMPPFVHDGRLTVEEIVETYNIASVRIHVERCIQRIKLYKILDKIPVELFPHIDNVVHICCVLTNLQPHIIRQESNIGACGS